MVNLQPKSYAFLVMAFTIHAIAFSQTDSIPERYTSSNKGKFFFSWGGNRDSYSKSDITFKGEDYYFRLDDVEAHDKPKGWHIDYINPFKMTNPQTNAKIGYYISDKYTVSLGLDHMKYVMKQNQQVNITGEINLPADEAGAVFNGSYMEEPVYMSADFLLFEHTDGLNYIYAEFGRVDDISSIFKIRNTDKFQLSITEGIGGGVLYPKTNATLMYKDRHDEFHVAGYGLSANLGLIFTFFKHFYIQTDLRGGYINMQDIRTTHSEADSAEQDFFFLQRVISLGGIFRL
ncbi:MAG: hypothetical protein BM564_00700 [Bacteroidetes bacterium MedPE-SWsnd-G2]|nr:MAG: hypothetical protein BM564_00700 [Bacteroidetes bacterium MedPE-SWsnd-G2]